MTYVKYELRCDPSYAGPPGPCAATVKGATTAAALRDLARKQGWQVGGALKGDRCPSHRIPRTPGRYGRST